MIDVHHERYELTGHVTWPGMELRHLLALMAVAETGTFSRAAEKSGTPSPRSVNRSAAWNGSWAHGCSSGRAARGRFG